MPAFRKPAVLSTLALLLATAIATPAPAQTPEISLGAEARDALSLTVYNQDLALWSRGAGPSCRPVPPGCG
ncbi:MAG: hypothetical protein QNJ06_14505 [Kiloniellales bacterium]|nr:hypothetical protein [Kiloniellales bacterium]